ncbi:ADP-ribosylglycohydrolase family protein [Evansella tamaricis]|uniref:ADP-ribosylglycohydrolase family protein n=1 Tax=Evansella tamaricis TaxID=2069301 RepID=A0ABS6JKD3_9BACI|nr:ADP-ribosylglycohydrolase family protein [Evansella tamaricis]
MRNKDTFVGSLVGLAVGDCVGVSVEFSPPGTFEPVQEMTGGGPFGLNPGEWTDDTSMTLCLATSLIEKEDFDAKDQMERYVKWYKEGYLSSRGSCFDIGNTVRDALHRFLDTGEPFSGSSDQWSAGNGSIMRLAPIPLFWSHDMEEVIYFSGESSRTTHQAAEAVDACHYFGALIAAVANGTPKDTLLSREFTSFVEEKLGRELRGKIKDVAEGSFKYRVPPEINGKGYVVSSLEAALWAFYLTDNFRDGLLMVVNLGEDSDTTGAIYGQLAGAYYGIDAIPSVWCEKLVERELIESFAEKLFDLQEKKFDVAFKGTTCEYEVFFNEQDQQFYKMDFNCTIDVFLEGEWVKGYFKNAYIGTGYNWRIHLPHKGFAIEVPEGTKIRLSKEFLEGLPMKNPTCLGGKKEYELFCRGKKRIEATKRLRMEPF